MLEGLGYELLTPDTASVVVGEGWQKISGRGACADAHEPPDRAASRRDPMPAPPPVSSSRPRGFTRDAEAYAVTAPLKQVDGPKLVPSTTRSG